MRPVFVKCKFLSETRKAINVSQDRANGVTTSAWFPKSLILSPRTFPKPQTDMELRVGDWWAINRGLDYTYCFPETINPNQDPNSK